MLLVFFVRPKKAPFLHSTRGHFRSEMVLLGLSDLFFYSCPRFFCFLRGVEKAVSYFQQSFQHKEKITIAVDLSYFLYFLYFLNM